MTDRIADLEGAGVRLVMMTLVDTAGYTRVKIVPLSRLASVARSGVGWSDIWAVVCSDDHFAADDELHTPSGDMRLIPDLAVAVPLAARPGWAWAPADMRDQEGPARTTCPRTAATLREADVRARGLDVRATFEIEFTLLRDGQPAHRGPGYSAPALSTLDGFALDLYDALTEQGVGVEQLHPEYSPGQFEISVAPTGAVAAADTLVLCRTTMRQVAIDHGLEVSFTPCAVFGEAGNGCHLHLSLWRDGTNLMTGGDLEGGLQAEAGHALAGVIESLRGMVALLVPTAPGYERLRPGMWSGATLGWGVENRETAVRVITGSLASRRSSANMELKLVDGTANPYLVIAAALGSMVDGLDRRLELPRSVTGEPLNLDAAGRAACGIRPTPATLAEAVEALAIWEAGPACLGATLHRSLVAVGRREWELQGHRDPAELALDQRLRY